MTLRNIVIGTIGRGSWRFWRLGGSGRAARFSGRLFDGDGFGQISGLVNVAASVDGDVGGEEVEGGGRQRGR